VHEVLRCTEDISRLIAAGGAASEIQRWAISEGMVTMRSNALSRVGAGELSLDEFFRVFS
jgi:type IV pilus assembly protein PilB